jgi:hypothetical protein
MASDGGLALQTECLLDLTRDQEELTHRFFCLDGNIARRLEYHDCAVYMYKWHGRNGSEPYTKKL